MNRSQLPITYYDIVMSHQWPRFRHAIRADVATLRAQGVEGPINTVDAFPSALPAAAKIDIRGLAGEFARRLGVDVDTAISLIEQNQPSILESFLAAYNYAYHSVLNFERAGRKTFFFRDGLSERLLATSVAADSGLVRLPFYACQFVFTARGVIQAMEMLNTNDGSPLVADYKTPVSVFATELTDERYGGRVLVLVFAQATAAGTRTLMKRELLLIPGRPIEEALQTDWTTLRGNIEDGEELVGRLISSDQSQDLVSDDLFYTDGLLIIRLVLNAILYLTSDNAVVADHPAPRRDAEHSNHRERRRLERQSPLGYASVGDNFPPIYVDTRSNRVDDSSSDGTSDLHRLQHKMLVRGHWRYQAHGQQSLERKLIWVEPYLRGPDLADVVNKPYVVR